jgi:hypothetical protein
MIMGFPDPRPRNIEKDVKVFPWSFLLHAIRKVIQKYVCLEVGSINFPSNLARPSLLFMNHCRRRRLPRQRPPSLQRLTAIMHRVLYNMILYLID